MVGLPLTSPELAEEDLDRIARIVRAFSGIVLNDRKRHLVVSRLVPRLQKLSISTFSEYCDYLESVQGRDEIDCLTQAITTNVTAFFREAHHFRFLQESVLPRLVRKAFSGTPIRIWSAGCSSGEEAYSIAISTLFAVPELASCDFRILATDIDRGILQLAYKAEYSRELLSQLPTEEMREFFEQKRGNSLEWTPKPQVKGLVLFKYLNLQADWPFRRQFDVIFCRNVAIYFDRGTQERLWGRFAEHLDTGGTLFLGHSERISGHGSRFFNPVGITTYERI